MVGAGFSNSVVRTRGRCLPAWGALTERMIHDLKGRVSKSTITRLRALPWKSYCLEVAEEFKKSTRSDSYALFLRDQLDPPDFVRSAIHEIVLAIEFKGIITTNFDRVIEFHTDRFRPLIYPHFLEEPESHIAEGGSMAGDWSSQVRSMASSRSISAGLAMIWKKKCREFTFSRAIASGRVYGAPSSQIGFCTRLTALTVPMPVAKSQPTPALYAGLYEESDSDRTPMIPPEASGS